MSQPTEQPSASSLVSTFAPSGTLRASINVGNPILAHRQEASLDPGGVSVDLAREFARRLDVPIEFVVFGEARESVGALREEAADIGFFAIDPARSDGLRFTAPYVLIEGAYLVPEDSPLTANDEVDRPDRRISVGLGSAYDLFLTREIKQAEILRFEGAQLTLGALHDGVVEVAAGIRQLLDAEAERTPGVRVLPGRFMVIRQAMGIPAGRGAEAQAFLAAYVEEMKASGFVAEALQRHGVEGASVAPAAADDPLVV